MDSASSGASSETFESNAAVGPAAPGDSPPLDAAATQRPALPDASARLASDATVLSPDAEKTATAASSGIVNRRITYPMTPSRPRNPAGACERGSAPYSDRIAYVSPP